MNLGLVLSSHVLREAGKKDLLEVSKEEGQGVVFKKFIDALAAGDGKEKPVVTDSKIAATPKRISDAITDYKISELDLRTAIKGIIADVNRAEPLLKNVLSEAKQDELEDSLAQIIDILNILPKSILENIDQRNLLTVLNSSEAVVEQNIEKGNGELIQYNLNLLTHRLKQLFNSDNAVSEQNSFNMSIRESDVHLKNTFQLNKVHSSDIEPSVGSPNQSKELKKESNSHKEVDKYDKTQISATIQQIVSFISILPEDVQKEIYQNDLKSSLSLLKSVMNFLTTKPDEDSFIIPEGFALSRATEKRNKSFIEADLSNFKEKINRGRPNLSSEFVQFSKGIDSLESFLSDFQLVSKDSVVKLLETEKEENAGEMPGTFMDFASNTYFLLKILKLLNGNEELEFKGVKSSIKVLDSGNDLIENILNDNPSESNTLTATKDNGKEGLSPKSRHINDSLSGDQKNSEDGLASFTKSNSKDSSTLISKQMNAPLGENQKNYVEKEQGIIHSKVLDPIVPKGKLRILEDAFTRNQLGIVRHDKTNKRVPSLSLKYNTNLLMNFENNSEPGRAVINKDQMPALSSVNNFPVFQNTLPRTEPFFLALKTGESEQTLQQFTKDFTSLIGKSQLLQTPNMNKLLIKLYPEQLGSIRIEILQNNGVITAKLLASTKMTKELLDSQLSGLRQAFMSQNLQVDKIEVSQTLLESYRQERQSSHNHHGHQQQKEEKQDEQKTNRNSEEHDFKEFLNMTELI
ncbi:flagellar hook-length control protein FliK [Rossellomorea aquimaris]|uniref:Flagellar hook-length control protein-like C-terminal domain-containing protein n=1 Tax=Rossellomorea aquimaris TaxID=189382 RepID=A0A5D4U570_9BACI|nr:flagellar hook-length control protein FliK [Rossellomorea aquimaris]TYS82467.1 hypothetical protein FZC80_06115 [Rossellomorea aquimaris]